MKTLPSLISRRLKGQVISPDQTTRLVSLCAFLSAQIRSLRSISFGKSASGDSRASASFMLIKDLNETLEGMKDTDENAVAIGLGNLFNSAFLICEAWDLPMEDMIGLISNLDSDNIGLRLDPNNKEHLIKTKNIIEAYRERLKEEESN